MSVDGQFRSRRPRRGIRRFARTGAGRGLADGTADLDPRGLLSISWAASLLLAAGLWQQVNLILLVFTLSAGPFLASIFGGRAMLRRLSVVRRVPGVRFFGRSAGHRLLRSKMAGAGSPRSRSSWKIPWFPSIARRRERSA